MTVTWAAAMAMVKGSSVGRRYGMNLPTILYMRWRWTHGQWKSTWQSSRHYFWYWFCAGYEFLHPQFKSSTVRGGGAPASDQFKIDDHDDVHGCVVGGSILSRDRDINW